MGQATFLRQAASKSFSERWNLDVSRRSQWRKMDNDIGDSLTTNPYCS